MNPRRRAAASTKAAGISCARIGDPTTACPVAVDHDTALVWDTLAHARSFGVTENPQPVHLYSARKISAARSPMMTQGAMVLPVVARGMIDPSAIRSLSIP